MAETQVHNIKVTKTDMSHYDTGGGVRRVEAVIEVDNSLPLYRQRQVCIQEVLGIYLGCVIGRGTLEEIAESISDCLDELEEK